MITYILSSSNKLGSSMFDCHHRLSF
uniref:Uncharacterized protein n=1 Tax=Rhizophora mucronata TaxID=61149 RepID=A0A2P2PH12_RHIMU